MDTVDESLHEEPFVWALRTHNLGRYCTFCVKRATEVRQLARCTLCLCVHYCSKECQTADWADHQIECKRFQAVNIQLKQNSFPDKIRRLSLEFPDDFLRMVARLVGKMMKEESQQVSSGGRRFGDLASNLSEMANAESEIPKKAFEEFCELYAHWVGRRPKKIHQMGLLPVYAKAKTNLFIITDDAQEPIGVGLYLSLSRIDHSCDPNGALVFRGKEATIIPVKKASFDAPLQWSQLTRALPYVDVLCTLEERRLQLKERYYFDCHCDACQDQYRNDTMEAFACSDQLCMGRAMPQVEASKKGSSGRRTIVCGKCRKVLSKLEMTQAETAKRLCDGSLDALREANTLQKQSAVMQKCADAVQGTLHKYNLQRMNALKGVYQCYLALKNHKEAAKYGRMVLDIVRFYSGEYDPGLLVFSMHLVGVVAAAGEADAAMSLLRTLMDRSEHIYGKTSEALTYIDPTLDASLVQQLRQNQEHRSLQQQ